MTSNLLKVDKSNEGRRIDNYLFYILKTVPKTKVYNMIRRGEIRVNSRRIKASTRININDEIRLPPYININNDENIIKIHKKYIEIFESCIIAEHKDFLVINKPYGISVHKGSKTNYGLIDIARNFYEDNSIDLCHRLDKETSGCIILSRNKRFLSFINKLFITGQVHKSYIGVIAGRLDKPIYINNRLKTHHLRGNKLSIESKKGKYAKSLFKPISYYKNLTLVEIEIFTGKLHQIRSHSSQMNMPILNDKKYGNYDQHNNPLTNLNRLALHSHTIEFVDQDKNKLSFQAKLDLEFNKAIEIFK